MKRIIFALSATALAGLVAGCGSDENGSNDSSSSQDLPQGSEEVQLDPSEFTTEIDNAYWPMTPGSRWVCREADSEGTEQRVVVTVTDRIKKIANGVEARVVRDVVTENGVPVEVTMTGTPRTRRATSGTSARTRPSTRTASRSRSPARSRPASTGRRPGSSCRRAPSPG
jgi:hypothetical protein